MQIMGMDLPEDQRNAPWGSVYFPSLLLLYYYLRAGGSDRANRTPRVRVI